MTQMKLTEIARKTLEYYFNGKKFGLAEMIKKGIVKKMRVL